MTCYRQLQERYERNEIKGLTFIPSKQHVHDGIAGNTGQKVDEWFYGKYCAECSLDANCNHVFNPHCHKVAEDHLKTVVAIANLVSRHIKNSLGEKKHGN